jgi:PHD/YefM family antitoxin component YafN of YafNO toxin-antitoxin module
MTLQAQKLEIVQLVLEADDKKLLQKVKIALRNRPNKTKTGKKPKDDTEYLLSTEANRKALAKGISQLNKGQKKAIKTADLWK